MSKPKAKHAGGRPRIANRANLLEYKVEVNFSKAQLASIDTLRGDRSRAQYIRLHVLAQLNAPNVVTNLPREISNLPQGLSGSPATQFVTGMSIA